jgi:hypothetical protein
MVVHNIEVDDICASFKNGINLFAEVPKRIVLSDGSYNVLYA